MTTLEMMNEAAKTGKTYISEVVYFANIGMGNIMYSSTNGFYEKRDTNKGGYNFNVTNEILKLKGWIEKPLKKMTIKEAEEKYDIKITWEDK